MNRTSKLWAVIAAAIPVAAVAEPLASIETAGLDLDAGATIFAGFGGFVADETAPGEAAWRREAEQVPVYLLAKFSASHAFDDGSAASLFVRVKPFETPGIRTDVLPDSDEIVKDGYLRFTTPDAGEFRLGYQADVRANEAYYAPQVCNCADGFFGTNTAEATFANGPIPENSTAADLDSRAPKLAWYSPLMDGFRVSASYAPEPSMGRNIDGRLSDLGISDALPGSAEIADLQTGRYRQFWSAALEWTGSVDEVSLGAETGFSHAEAAGPLVTSGLNDASPLVWDAGVTASYAAWKFGGAYEQQNFVDLEGVYGASAYQPVPGMDGRAIYLPPATNGIVTRTFDLGASYTIGPVTLGAAWSRGTYEGLIDAALPKLTATNDVVFGGAQYQIDPHLAMLVGVQVNRYAPDSSGAHPLPESAGLDRVYGGSDAGLNIWDRNYSGVALLIGVSARF